MAIHLDQYRLSYFPVPKVACTSLKHLLFRIETGAAFQNIGPDGRPRSIHDVYPTGLFALDSEAAPPDFRRFAVVRDPVSRIVSCYRSRVVFYRELSPSALADAGAPADLPPDPDLPQFVERLDDYRAASESIAHHAAPLSDFLGTDTGFYERIFGWHELEVFRNILAAACGIEELVLPHLQTGGPIIDIGDLSTDVVRTIERRFAEDSALFGAHF